MAAAIRPTNQIQPARRPDKRCIRQYEPVKPSQLRIRGNQPFDPLALKSHLQPAMLAAALRVDNSSLAELARHALAEFVACTVFRQRRSRR